jgi:iron complex outermembrane receptor protein
MKKLRATCAAASVAALQLSLPSIALAQPSVQLPSTTVSATRFPDNSQSLPFGVSVITSEDIARSGAANINEALMRVLGVVGRVDLMGGGEYSVDLRGFGAGADNNQVVIVDGMRLSEADLGGTRLAGIPIESVERIEVLRGSGSVLYGEGATGGVIVITTKAGAGKSRASGGSVYAGAGSYGLRDLRANGNYSAGGFTVDGALQKRDSDGHRDNFRSRTEAGSLAGSWANEWLRINAQHSEDRLDTGLPGALSAAQYAANPRQATTPTDHGNVRNERTGASAEAQSGNWQVVLDAGTRGKKVRTQYAFGPYDYDISADNWSLRARGSHDFGGVKNLLVVGTDSLRWTRDVLGVFGSTAKSDSRAWYAKDDVTLAGGTRIGLGWRTEHADKSNTVGGAVDARENAWELGVSHPFGAVTAYARVGRSFRFANVDEFSFTSLGVNLAPQTSRDVEVGARWNHGGGKVEARLYRNDLTNEIGFDPAAADPFGSFFGANVNFDPTRRQGLEVDATQRIASNLGLRLNANAREATFRSGPYAGKEVPLAARRSLALRADWAPAPQHRLSGGVVWVSSQHPDFANACTMPAYTTVDARYAYDWKQAEFSVGVTNLADRKFYTQAFACAAGQVTSIYPEAGRAFTAAVRVKF